MEQRKRVNVLGISPERVALETMRKEWNIPKCLSDSVPTVRHRVALTCRSGPANLPIARLQ